MKDFPLVAGVVDLAWGAGVSGAVCGIALLVARRSA
jgi:uncharacterized membrane protein